MIERLVGLPVQAKLILAGAALLAAFGAGYALANVIAAANIAELKEHHTEELNAALMAKLAAEDWAHMRETDGRKETNDALVKYKGERDEEQAVDARTIADLRADIKRLRVSTRPVATSGGALPVAGPDSCGAAAQVEQTLAGSVAARLAGRYSDYNQIVGQLDLCVSQLERDRKITAPRAE